MSKQLSFFGTSIDDVREQILTSLSSVLTSNGLDGLSLSFVQQKTANKYAAKFIESVVVYVYHGKLKTYLEFPCSGPSARDNKDTYKVYLDSLTDVSAHLDEIEQSLQTILDRFPKDFSCCSRYEECSNQGICICPDKRMALGCFYRKQLSHGKIFYGKNRNIE